jgi:hypothetical protein
MGRTQADDWFLRQDAAPVVLRGPDQLLPCAHEGLDDPVLHTRRGRAGAAHGIGGQSPVGKRREDGAPTEQEPTGEQRPEPPEQTKIASDGHVGQCRTQEDSKAVDRG